MTGIRVTTMTSHRAVTRLAQTAARSKCFVGAVGSMIGGSSAWRTAAAPALATRTLASSTLGFGVLALRQDNEQLCLKLLGFPRFGGQRVKQKAASHSSVAHTLLG